VKRVLRLLSWIFGAVGVGLLIGAGVAATLTVQFRARSVEASGKIVDQTDGSRSSGGGRSYAPVFEFIDADGQRHRVRANVSSNPPAYDVGDAVTVRYDPRRPEHARIDSFLENWFVATLLGGLGVVFAGIAAGFVVSGVAGRRRRAWLEQHGLRVDAKVVGVALDSHIRVNNRNPWRIQAQWLDPQRNTMHLLQSEAIWFDPSDLLPPTIGVWIDPNNPKRYWMDVGFLPQEG
jgi:hypothetical protein